MSGMVGSRVPLWVVLLVMSGAPAQSPVAVLHDLQYAEGFARDGRRNTLDLYLPGGVEDAPVVMFVHGGSWSAGSKERYRGLGEALARNGLACAKINTRMFPFVRPDKMVEDCAHACRWLHDHGAEYGYDGDRLFLMGHSAGAHLVSWLATDDSKWRISGVPREALRGVLAMSGVYDTRPRHVLLDSVFGLDLDFRLASSPILHASAEAPPFLLLWAGRDLAGLALGGRILAERLRHCGVPVETIEMQDSNHVDYVFRLGRPGSTLLPRLVDYVNRMAGARAERSRTDRFEVTRSRAVLGEGALPVDLFAPDAQPRQLLVLAVSGAERAAGINLAREVARYGGAVAVVDCSGLAELADADALAGFTAAVRRLDDVRSEYGLPDAAPFLGAIGETSWLIAATPLPAAGRLLLGAPAVSAVVRGVLHGERDHGQRADRMLEANASPIVLVWSRGDPEAAHADAKEMSELVTRKDDFAVRLEYGPVSEMLREVGPDDVTLVPLVSAFLGL